LSRKTQLFLLLSRWILISAVGIASGEGKGRGSMDKYVNPFYKSKAWQAKRKAILRRDGYMCVECRKYGRRRDATVVHHILELEEHPELALNDKNLISLCDSCHNKMHPEKGGNWR